MWVRDIAMPVGKCKNRRLIEPSQAGLSCSMVSFFVVGVFSGELETSSFSGSSHPSTIPGMDATLTAADMDYPEFDGYDAADKGTHSLLFCLFLFFKFSHSCHLTWQEQWQHSAQQGFLSSTISETYSGINANPR